MKHLLLMRHGEAVDGAPGGDGDRWLTSHGRQTTRAVAEHLARHMAPATVWTSPLVRAVQTAEILASAVGLQGSVEVLRELATGHDDAILQHVADFEGDGTLCLVGHEPTLSQLAVTLLGVRQWPGFKKSGVCCVRWHGSQDVRFEWLLLPRHLRVVTDLAAAT